MSQINVQIIKYLYYVHESTRDASLHQTKTSNKSLEIIVNNNVSQNRKNITNQSIWKNR